MNFIGFGLLRQSNLIHHLSQRFFTPVSHVIFDLDGTIIDSETIYEAIYAMVLERYGKKFTKEVRLAIHGTTEQDASRIMVEKLKLPITPEQYWDEIDKLRKIHLTNPNIKPGAERLIRHLSERKVPLAIATSSSEKGYLLKTACRPDIFHLFHHIVTGSSDPEVINGKPAPDIFLVTARRFPEPAEPTKCLVFEDAPNGVIAASTAGMKVVMVPEFTWPEESTKCADLIIESLEKFVPQQFGLPAYSEDSSTAQCHDTSQSPDNTTD